ncbi:MAG: 6-carboxytetrahydropterin synthase [Enterobacterales bacterium]|nr:6-carboxytetrahydropterin synthase [Enterobacterales bacterium]
MRALFVDNLTVIDFAYLDLDRGIIGESLILSVELFGELNDEGMLFDFSFVKKRIKACVDSLVDHKLLVARHHADLKIIEKDQLLELSLQNSNYAFEHISPSQAVCIIDDSQVSIQSIKDFLTQQIKNILPDNVNQLTVYLDCEQTDKPYYHYSHGLKKHFGDCQRIAHGHRSKIEVWQKNIDDNLWLYSSYWSLHIAELWQDIYLATKEDIKAEITFGGFDCWQFAYQANQGDFKLTLPKSRCYLISTDTTVELIVDFLAGYLKQQAPLLDFKVKAFEGVDKGALASSCV